MSWIKATFSGLGAAILAFLAFLAVSSAKRHKNEADKWKARAEAEKQSDVEDSAKKANQSLSQAKLHNAKASEAKERARVKIDQIAKKDPDMASIVSGWRSGRLN